MPARSTLPAVGASVWASGSQVCTGTMGILMMKASTKAANSQPLERRAQLGFGQLIEREGVGAGLLAVDDIEGHQGDEHEQAAPRR